MLKGLFNAKVIRARELTVIDQTDRFKIADGLIDRRLTEIPSAATYHGLPFHCETVF